MSSGLTRRSILVAGFALATQGLLGFRPGDARASSGPPSHEPGLETLARAVAWLRTQRTEDGRYPSRRYGLLRGGASLTPFTLLALDRAGALTNEEARGSLEALAARCTERGALGLREVVADYPCYASGMMLSTLGRRADVAPSGLAARTRGWLLEQQLTADRGWHDHPGQGGWGMGSETIRTPPDAGHVDLSMTRRVIEGLVASGVEPDHPALREARDFVLRCQTDDGSFFYSPVELALNKGHPDAVGRPRGYGSATTDGWHALAALDRATSEPAERALAWLRAHHRLDASPGVEDGPMHLFAEAMRGYYRAGSASVFNLAGGPTGWRSALIETITAEQRPDGSFANPSPLQKEDDPLIATAFAVTALAAAEAS